MLELHGRGALHADEIRLKNCAKRRISDLPLHKVADPEPIASVLRKRGRVWHPGRAKKAAGFKENGNGNCPGHTGAGDHRNREEQV